MEHGEATRVEGQAKERETNVEVVRWEGRRIMNMVFECRKVLFREKRFIYLVSMRSRAWPG